MYKRVICKCEFVANAMKEERERKMKILILFVEKIKRKGENNTYNYYLFELL